MPCVKIRTNVQIAADKRASFIAEVSRRTAEVLGKPEKFVMVILEPWAEISFAGSPEPAAYVELKSIGLPEEKTDELSAFLCEEVNKGAGIPADRIYIEFADAVGAMWGWNGGTFRRL